jgi:hypothetical protein
LVEDILDLSQRNLYALAVMRVCSLMFSKQARVQPLDD